MVLDRSLQQHRLSFWLPLILHYHVLVTRFHFKTNLQMTLCLRSLCFYDEMVVAMGAVLVGLFEFLDSLAEDLLALLAGKHELHGLHELVLALSACPVLLVALWAVEPFLAAGGSDAHLGV